MAFSTSFKLFVIQKDKESRVDMFEITEFVKLQLKCWSVFMPTDQATSPF